MKNISESYDDTLFDFFLDFKNRFYYYFDKQYKTFIMIWA